MGSLYLLSKLSESVPTNNKNKPSMRHFLLAADYVVSVLLLQGIWLDMTSNFVMQQGFSRGLVLFVGKKYNTL